MFADIGEEAAYGLEKLHSLLAKCTRLNNVQMPYLCLQIFH